MTPLEWLITMFVGALGTTIAVFKKYYMPQENPLESPTMPSNSKTPVVSNPTQSTPVEPILSPTATTPTLDDFLKWQWQLEGANPAIKNPGNYRFFYGGYLPIYEPVGISKGGFAIFPTLALGQLYAKNSTKNVIKNHPELTILTYIGGDGDWRGYAPVSDGNNPPEYADFIASHLSVDNGFLMRDLVV